MCTSSPPDINVCAARSEHEVSLSYGAEGIVDAGAFVGSPHEIAAFPVNEHTQGVAVHAGLPHEVASAPLGVPAETSDCRPNNRSVRNLAAPVVATTVATPRGRCVSCERPRDPPANVSTLRHDPFLDNVSDPVFPQGGAVELVRPKPLTLDPASHSIPSPQVTNPEDLAKELLVARLFISVSNGRTPPVPALKLARFS